ncbi:UTP--glucose-1-phosphate uridylyltransferase GalU [soil metagenome]
MSMLLEQQPTTALILAGGVGTRDLPMTKLIPKELAEVYGLPLIAHVVLDLMEVGVENIVTVVGEDFDEYGQNYQEIMHRRWFGSSPRLEEYLVANDKEHLLPKLEQRHGLNFEYVRQPHGGKYGTAIPLHVARKALKGSGSFMAVNGDDLMHSPEGRAPLRDFAEETTGARTANGMMFKRVPRQKSGRYPYGMGVLDPEGRLLELAEKPWAKDITGEPLANVGKYIFNEKDVFNALGSYVKLSEKRRGQKEYYLTDVVSMLSDVQGHVTEAQFLDAGDKDLRLIASMIKAGMRPKVVTEARNLLLNKMN